MFSCNIKARTFQLKPSTPSAPSLAYIRAGHPHVGTDGEGIWTISSKRGCVNSLLQINPKCKGDAKSPKIGYVLNGWPLSVRFQNWYRMTKGPRPFPRCRSRLLEKSGAVCSFSLSKNFRRATTQQGTLPILMRLHRWRSLDNVQPVT